MMNASGAVQEAASELSAVLAAFRTHRLIGIVRTGSAEDAVWCAEQLIRSGFGIIEITQTTPDATEVIRTLAEAYPEVVIGGGTVLDTRTAIHTLAAGGRFVVSPVLEESLVQFGAQERVLVLPGVMTPTEMHWAIRLGAFAVKLFPASAIGGPAFIKTVREPLPQVQIIPTGGIAIEDVAAYLQAGALAVGLGGVLLPKNAVRDRDAETIQALAAQALAQLTRHQP
jgi:2-dehydro-3-deoxyphosphogluconate aldolase/(4S)-4-hydroxy-2-oxoglutarate aldolase